MTEPVEVCELVGASALRRRLQAATQTIPILFTAVGDPVEGGLVPSLTEALFALGAGGEVVGTTRFCTQPAAARATAKVGGTKTLDVGAVLTLRPDLVVASAEENRREDVEALIDAGLRVYVSLPRTVAEAMELLADLAGMLRRETAAGFIDEARAAVRELARGAVSPPRVFVPIWRRPYMAVGSGTYAGDLLRVCGGANVYATSPERYPTVTLDEVAALDPEVVLLPSEPYRFGPRHLADFERFPQMSAVSQGRVHLVDGRHLTWYGPRMADGLRSVAALLGGRGVAPRRGATA